MKKLFISFLASLFLFSACGSDFDDSKLVGGIDEIVVEGVLVSQSIASEKPGTHSIMTDDDKVYSVSSIAINLSDGDYVGNKVRIKGVLDEEKNLVSVTSVSILEILDLNDSLDEEVDFLDYMDTDFGVSFSYYSNWEYETDGGLLVFKSPLYSDSEDLENEDLYDVFSISQSSFSYEPSVFDGDNVDTPLKSYVATMFPEITSIEDMSVSIGPDRLDSFKISNESGGDTYFLYRNGLIYEISYLPAEALLKSPYYNDYKKMINSFTFVGFTIEDNLGDFDIGDEYDEFNSDVVEADESVLEAESVDLDSIDMDFSFYESKPYSFRSVYPSSWYYRGDSAGDGILHHYGFSDESVEDGNELISLNVFHEKDLSDFKLKNVNGKSVFVSTDEDTVSYYLEFDGKVFGLSGDIDYSDLMKVMITSFESVDED